MTKESSEEFFKIKTGSISLVTLAILRLVSLSVLTTWVVFLVASVSAMSFEFIKWPRGLAPPLTQNSQLLDWKSSWSQEDYLARSNYDNHWSGSSMHGI